MKMADTFDGLSEEDKVRAEFLFVLKDKLGDLLVTEIVKFGKDDPQIPHMIAGLYASMILDLESVYPQFAQSVVATLATVVAREMGLDSTLYSEGQTLN